MGELDEQGTVILLLSAKSLSAALKYEGQQRRKVVKSMSQQALPWYSDLGWRKPKPQSRACVRDRLGVRRKGLARLGSRWGLLRGGRTG
jgi:hypothetical protein